MKFIVKRTSNYGDNDIIPCKGAKVEYLPDWELRTCSEEYFNKHFAPREGEWRSKGTEHEQIGENLIARRREKDEQKWIIEISSLKKLMEFINQEGEIVISAFSQWEAEGIDGIIEIYDTYRE